MIEISLEYHQARIKPGISEVVVFELVNSFGAYLFTDSKADPGLISSGGTLLGYGPYVKSFGAIRESLSAGGGGDLLAAFKRTEAGALTMTMLNGDNLFGKIAARENLLGATGLVLIGYPNLDGTKFVQRFSGTVKSYSMTRETAGLQLVAA